MKKLLKKIRSLSSRRGFTLIELLIVIAIIGILIAVGTSSYTKAVKLSRDSKRKADLEQIRQALETRRSELGSYPATLAELQTGSYIQTVPSDPKVGFNYFYTRPSATTYTLCAYLETQTTASTCGSTNSCGSACNYGTAQP